MKPICKIALAIAVGMSMLAQPGMAALTQQEGSQLFPETGKTVRSRFLTYWREHGGLAQQGYPISEEMQEVSDTDGKTYTVQYFERAVFEYHPEEKAEFQVLLSLLGVSYYQQKYGTAGAPNQSPSNTADAVLVPETGKRLGGIFLKYWREQGGLAQQGYPISDEFNEVSDLNGKTYKVQYFQRAVFEYHPEEKPEFQVLLSQLGTFQHNKKYQNPAATPSVAIPALTPTTEATLTPLPEPTAPPTPTPDPACADIPTNRDMTITPNCVWDTTTFLDIVAGPGYTPGEETILCVQDPTMSSCVRFSAQTAEGDGRVVLRKYVRVDPFDPPGIYLFKMTGQRSGFEAVGYLRKTR